jgi:hypothetical protein
MLLIKYTEKCTNRFDNPISIYYIKKNTDDDSATSSQKLFCDSAVYI